MKKYSCLLGNISYELNIQRGNNEGENGWKCRIIYSLLGRMAYASLWDIQENVEPTSIIHFKRRIKNVLDAYIDMYPEIEKYFNSGINELCEELYNIFLCTGQIYHSPYKITPAQPSICKCQSLFFIRGAALNLSCRVSGLGTYSTVDQSYQSYADLNVMFQLARESLKKQWTSLLAHAIWNEKSLEVGMEYLRTKPPFNRGYWVDNPNQTGIVSLARIGEKGNYIYYLYQYKNDVWLYYELPVWRVIKSNYRSISNSCLAFLGTLPPIQYHVDGKIVYLRIRYLLPNEEMNFIKLYSWPTSYLGLPHDFSRVCNAEVFEAIKVVLESIGYQFVEEK